MCLIADATNHACIERDESSGRSAFYATGTPIAGGQPWPMDQVRTLVAAWQPDELALWDGALTTVGASIATPVTSVGFGTDTIAVLHGHLRRVTYWRDRLADAELAGVGSVP